MNLNEMLSIAITATFFVLLELIFYNIKYYNFIATLKLISLKNKLESL